ncbi:MAG: hypothetical protein Tsb0015_02770 [Simkaniaceae bacterium]
MTTQALNKINNSESNKYRKNPENPKPCPGINLFGNSEMTLEIIKSAELTTLADVKVLHFISQTQIPCRWEPKIMAIVPNLSPKNLAALQKFWQIYRDRIREELGNFTPPSSMDMFLEKNSALTVDELLQDEQEGAKSFYATCQKIASSAKGQAHFGPDNANITKSKDSIESKIKRMQAESDCTVSYAIQQIDDGVRGTISFEKPSDLKQGFKQFVKIAEKNSWKIEVSNLWENEEDYGGYIDVDVRIVIPLPNGRQVIGELQFHLKDFYDGTKESPVSRAHKVYEEMRMIPVTGKSEKNLSYTELNETSRLYFATALFHASYSNCK